MQLVSDQTQGHAAPADGCSRLAAPPSWRLRWRPGHHQRRRRTSAKPPRKDQAGREPRRVEWRHSGWDRRHSVSRHTRAAWSRQCFAGGPRSFGDEAAGVFPRGTKPRPAYGRISLNSSHTRRSSSISSTSSIHGSPESSSDPLSSNSTAQRSSSIADLKNTPAAPCS